MELSLFHSERVAWLSRPAVKCLQLPIQSKAANHKMVFMTSSCIFLASLRINLVFFYVCSLSAMRYVERADLNNKTFLTYQFIKQGHYSTLTLI